MRRNLGNFGALTGSAVIVFMTGETLGINAGREQVAAREHYERIKEREIQSCLGRQGINLAVCVEEAAEAAQEQSDSRQDLYAQQDMSKWAAWLLALTAATFFLSAGGLWALLRTIRQGEYSLERAHEANLIAQQSNRAWIKIHAADEIFMDIADRDDDGLRVHFNISIMCENIGGSPATGLEVYGAVHVSDDINNIPEILDVMSNKGGHDHFQSNAPHFRCTVFPADRTEPITPPVKINCVIFPEDVYAFADQGELILVILAIYRSAGSGEVHRTPAFFRFMQPNRMFDGSTKVEYPIGGHHLMIRRFFAEGSDPT